MRITSKYSLGNAGKVLGSSGVAVTPEVIRAERTNLLPPRSLTPRIELKDDPQAPSSSSGPLPRWTRQDWCPREQAVSRQHCQCLLTVLPRKALSQYALNCLQAYAVFRAYRLSPDEQEQVEFERVEWQVI
jgi:hypothetical protein